MAIKEKIRKTFIDTTDLDLAHQEIGYLKDLCDAKDNVIAYQKELMQIQSESIKRYRQIEEDLKKLREEIENERKIQSRGRTRKQTNSD